MLRVENGLLRSKLDTLEAKLDRHIESPRKDVLDQEDHKGGRDTSKLRPMDDLTDMMVKIQQAKEEAMKHAASASSREQLSK